MSVFDLLNSQNVAVNFIDLNVIDVEFTLVFDLSSDDILDLLELVRHEVKLLRDVFVDIGHFLAQIFDLILQTLGLAVDLVVQVVDAISQGLTQRDVLSSHIQLD